MCRTVHRSAIHFHAGDPTATGVDGGYLKLRHGGQGNSDEWFLQRQNNHPKVLAYMTVNVIMEFSFPTWRIPEPMVVEMFIGHVHSERKFQIQRGETTHTAIYHDPVSHDIEIDYIFRAVSSVGLNMHNHLGWPHLRLLSFSVTFDQLPVFSGIATDGYGTHSVEWIYLHLRPRYCNGCVTKGGITLWRENTQTKRKAFAWGRI